MILSSFLFLFLLSLSAMAGHLEGCHSSLKVEIQHHDFQPRSTGLHKRLLIIAGVHGDEKEAQELMDHWLKRLHRIGRPSNHWRVIPIVNPDGVKNKTRFNNNGVDINRNFPTKDWDEHALDLWKKRLGSNPRRYPGPSGGSEIETQCLIKHIEDFRPDLVVSIHTPYGQFDFDGPADKKIQTRLLPWKRIGTFSGSLGRYLWDERGIPVLTIELTPQSLKKDLSGFIKLQDKLSDLLI